MDVPHEKRFTYEDYLTWDDGKRYELIDGVPFVMATGASANHQRVLRELFLQFGSFLRGKPCEVFVAPFDVRLNADEYDDTVVQPDIMVICDPSKIDRRSCVGVPDLIIEILSPSTEKRDRYDKFLLYQRVGVREFWIVDVEAKAVQVHILEGKKYNIHVYGDGDIIPVNVLVGFEVNLTDIFAGL